MIGNISLSFKFKGGFTLLEVLTASAVITIVGYLIITQIVSLQTKIARYTYLPEADYFLNNAIGEVVPVEENFKKGNLGSYANNEYNWQIRREVVEICSRYFNTEEIKKECYIDLYIVTVEISQSSVNIPELKREIFFFKTIEEEKDVGASSEKQ